MNSAQTRRVIAAGVIGNVLEWYDFAIYGYFASAIGRQFFPHEDAVAQLLSTFGVFALGYLMRPLGGVLVGHIGDQFGRRAALTFSVAAMAIPTFLIGLLPGYATWGLLAPVALSLLRMVQGLSVGGEYTSSMVFLVERAPEGRRGLMGAVTSCGAGAGTLLGSAVGATFAASMSTAALESWGWRILNCHERGMQRSKLHHLPPQRPAGKQHPSPFCPLCCGSCPVIVVEPQRRRPHDAPDAAAAGLFHESASALRRSPAARSSASEERGGDDGVGRRSLRALSFALEKAASPAVTVPAGSPLRSMRVAPGRKRL
jgi:MFS family permease